jgi:hypothetical protein
MYIVTVAPDCAPVAKAGRLPTYEGMRNGDIWGLQRRATQLGRPEYFLDADRLGDDTHFRTANLMRGGVAYSNFVTTVSTSHVGEARSACEAGRCWGGAAAGIDFPRCVTGPSGFFGRQPCSW